MTASYEHPSLRNLVTDEQRDRAAEHLQAVYAQGRLSEEDFDRRIGQVLAAENRKQLNEAFYGLVDVPSSPPTGTVGYPAYGSQVAVHQQGTAGGALAHFSGLFLSILGPGVGYALAKPGSATRNEAAKAFNFQLIALIGLVVGGTLSSVTGWGLIHFLVGLGWIAWVVLSIVGGVKAAQGGNWANPVKKVVKLNVLPEK